MLERSPFGIEALDEMTKGGLIKGSSNIVEGAPGTGKTTLGIQFIVNGILQYNDPGLILTFEEFPAQYYHDALNFGLGNITAIQDRQRHIADQETGDQHDYKPFKYRGSHLGALSVGEGASRKMPPEVQREPRPSFRIRLAVGCWQFLLPDQDP